MESTDMIKAPRAEIYRIITDFEGMPRHFPGTAKSVRCLRREGNEFALEVVTKPFFGRSMTIRMEGRLNPPVGFTATQASPRVSSRESLTLREVPGGTEVHYVNDMEFWDPGLRALGPILGRLALAYRNRAVTRRLRQMLE